MEGRKEGERERLITNAHHFNVTIIIHVHVYIMCLCN